MVRQTVFKRRNWWTCQSRRPRTTRQRSWTCQSRRPRTRSARSPLLPLTDKAVALVPKRGPLRSPRAGATVTAGDCELRRFDFPIYLWLPVRLFVGLTRPRKKIFGQEFAGEVEAVGKDVETLKPGDEIFANTGIGFGAWAEYKALPASGAIALKPANASKKVLAFEPTPTRARSRMHSHSLPEFRRPKRPALFAQSQPPWRPALPQSRRGKSHT